MAQTRLRKPIGYGPKNKLWDSSEGVRVFGVGNSSRVVLARVAYSLETQTYRIIRMLQLRLQP